MKMTKLKLYASVDRERTYDIYDNWSSDMCHICTQHLCKLSQCDLETFHCSIPRLCHDEKAEPMCERGNQ